jgi:hypothetical protein
VGFLAFFAAEGSLSIVDAVPNAPPGSAALLAATVAFALGLSVTYVSRFFASGRGIRGGAG